jgi:hypothetical protein
MKTYLAFELYPDGREEYVGMFSITPEKSDEYLRKYGLSSCIGDAKYHNYAIILIMFETIYGFTKGTYGFNISWETPSVANIYWKVPTWRIRETEKETSEDEPVQS